MSSFMHTSLLFVLALSILVLQRSAAATLPPEEVNALNLITKKMGATGWNFNANACDDDVLATKRTDPERNISCNCGFENNTCHITALEIKRYNLSGELPPELAQLPFLERIDFAYNYLHGSIPREWASLPLKFISLQANRLSGDIPSYLANFTSLTYLNLELNQFSGTVPRELGGLNNLSTLMLTSNRLNGSLPIELAELKNLSDFRISDSNFSGSVPDFIQNWKELKRLEIRASGLEGPIPSGISVLKSLTDLRIIDINATNQAFPDLSNMTGLKFLVLRNCNISGEIPLYIWKMDTLELLDLSFNKLYGELPPNIYTKDLVFLFLSGNFLSGNIPMFKKGMNVDLSYNNLTQQSAKGRPCQQRIQDVSLNLFRSSSMGKDIGDVCAEDFNCQKYWHSLYINCGGENVKTNGTTYEGDASVTGGAATFYQSSDNWGLSSTGDFMDDNNFQNRAYIDNVPSPDVDALYQTARLSPLSLTYYRRCLEHGTYTVRLHFAEIQFTIDNTYNSLGRRVFDILIQNDVVEKDFNIEVEAAGFSRPVTKKYNATVTNGILEIRFYWAGKGTTRIPDNGVYGPLVSAISVDPNFKTHSGKDSKNVGPILAGVLGFCLIVMALAIFWWRRHRRSNNGRTKDLEGLEIHTSSFTLRQIKAATNSFASANKIGEGGFGPVYKGLLPDGRVIAVKQLSAKSSQGNREFLNEIGVVSCMQHPNLVKIYGCCIERDQLLLVYEYMENNCLARALFGPEHSQLKLDWQTRQKICVGIARGLAFLHEESRLKIVHRDIKGTNVLLDKDLNPKISDFGLAKLHEEEKTHISTRIAGTLGYMAPEYALWGYLTSKADVYSFGVVALEIVSGKYNMSYGPEKGFACLLDWACHLQQSGNLMELVDQKMGSEFDEVEAARMIKLALLCTNATPSLRPTMSEVVTMLEGSSIIPDVIPEGSYEEDVRFKAIRDHNKQMKSKSVGVNQDPSSQSISSRQVSSGPSTGDLYEISEESYARVKARNEQYKQMERQSQVSTSISSMAVSSSTSARDLYDINSNY